MSPTRASEGSEGYLLSVADVDSFCCRGFDRVAVEVKPLRAGFLSGVGEKSADVAGVCHKSAESGVNVPNSARLIERLRLPLLP